MNAGIFIRTGLVAAFLLWLPGVRADEDVDRAPDGTHWFEYQYPPETPRFRLSGLARFLNRTYAGILDHERERSFFLGVGEEEDGLLVIDANYNEEWARIRVGDEELILQLEHGDDIEREDVEEDEHEVYPGEGFEALLRAYPDAEWKTEPDLHIDDWIQEAESEDVEASESEDEQEAEPLFEGYGEGIERYLANPDQPIGTR